MKTKSLLLTFLVSLAFALGHCKKGGDDNNLLLAAFFLNQNDGSTVDITLQGTLTSGGSPLANYVLASGAGSATSALSSAASRGTRANVTCPPTIPSGSVCAVTDANGAYSITISASVSASATTAGTVNVTLDLYDSSGVKQADMTISVTYADSGSTATAGAPVVNAAAGATVTITASTPTVTVSVVIPGTLVLPTCGTTNPGVLYNESPGSAYSYLYSSPVGALGSFGVNGFSGVGCKPTGMARSSGTATISYAYSYDSIGRLSSMNFPTVSGTSTNTYTATYNLAYRPSSLLLDKYTFVCQNSAAGSVTVDYIYDSAGRLTAIANLVPDTCFTSGAPSTTLTQTNTTFAYTGDAVQPTTQALLTSTSTISYVLDSSNRVTQQVSVNGTITSTSNHTYDSAGRLASSTSGTNTTTFTYDASGRLTQMVQPVLATSTATWTHSYDSDGNLQQVIHQTGTSTSTFTFSN